MSTHSDSGPVLGLDTCGAEATLALAYLQPEAVEVIRERTLGARTAGAMLTSAIADVLGGTKPPALRAIVVVRGPGSFTGMRIGLSATKALAEAASVPVVAVSRLAVLAANSHADAVALDAGRGNAYLRSADGMERLITPEELEQQLLKDGPRDLAVCERKLHDRYPAARLGPAPTALDAIRCARVRLEAADWDDIATLDALYLWRAEQMLGPAARAVE